MFVIQQTMGYGQGWENVSSDDGQPLRFDLKRDAVAELEDLLDSRRDAGMDCDSSNYRVTNEVDYAVAFGPTGDYLVTMRNTAHRSELMGAARWFRSRRGAENVARSLGGVVVSVPVDAGEALIGGQYFGPWRP